MLLLSDNYHNPTSESLFYERHQNFAFPITTTTKDGDILTQMVLPSGTGMKIKQSGIEGLAKLNQDAKSGKVELDDSTSFKGDGKILAASKKQEDGMQMPFSLDDDDQYEIDSGTAAFGKDINNHKKGDKDGKLDSLNLVKA